MFTKRIKALASLVEQNQKVIDIGTDHAYLPIYLYKTNITSSIVGSDTSDNVLKYSLKNLEKFNLSDKIKLIKSDGFTNITENFDVAVIAGMGFTTIKKIINNDNIPNTLIIQSNNDHHNLRKYMLENNYKIDKEITLKDNNHYYVIIRYIKGKDSLNETELLFGKSNNKDYYNYLSKHYNKIYLKSKDIKYLNYTNLLKSLIEKIPD